MTVTPSPAARAKRKAAPAALVGGRIDATVDGTGMEAAAVAAVADGVWDEARTGHVTAGTFGNYLDASISGVSTGGVSAGDIATAVWEFFVEGSVSAQCAMAIQMAEAAGNYTTSGQVRTFFARDGSTTRVVGTMSTDGNTRSATSITCP